MNGLDFSYMAGNYAVVFQMFYNNRKYALKCFTRDVLESKFKHQQIVKYINANPSKYFVKYEYLEDELWIDEEEYS
jgi:hypothetical protein